MNRKADAATWGLPEARARAAVGRWITQPQVREAVARNSTLAIEAMAGLEAVVGQLDQAGITWLALRVLGGAAGYRDGTAWPVPPWAGRTEAAPAGLALVDVARRTAGELAAAGLSLDPDSTSVLVVLSQLLLLTVGWDSATLVGDLNVPPVGGYQRDGRSAVWDQDSADRERRVLVKLAAAELEHIRAPYSNRAGTYDAVLLAILAVRPRVTADAIVKSLAAGEDWVASLRPYYDGRYPDDFRRTLQRALRRLRKP